MSRPRSTPARRSTGSVVPTWNYVAVHAIGPVEVIEDAARLHALVSRLTDHHEAPRDARWAVTDAPEPFIAGQLKGIVGIVLRIETLIGKRKLSQNRSEADRAGWWAASRPATNRPTGRWRRRCSPPRQGVEAGSRQAPSPGGAARTSCQRHARLACAERPDGRAGGPAKARETGGFRPAPDGRNILVQAVEEFDRWYQLSSRRSTRPSAASLRPSAASVRANAASLRARAMRRRCSVRPISPIAISASAGNAPAPP